MFFGEYEHSLDEKGRVTLPAGVRDELNSGVFVTRGPESCLLLFEIEHWIELSRKFKRGSISGNLPRVMFAGSQLKLDRAGRILLPAPLRDYAGLAPGESVIVVGVDDRLELWHPDRWARVTRSVVEGGTFVDDLAELGL